MLSGTQQAVPKPHGPGVLAVPQGRLQDSQRTKMEGGKEICEDGTGASKTLTLSRIRTGSNQAQNGLDWGRYPLNPQFSVNYPNRQLQGLILLSPMIS